MDFTHLENASDGKKYFNVNWGLTNKCNYECSYCHPDLRDGSIKPANYDDISRFVDDVFLYCEQKGVKPYFEFGGGEVTLFRWFGELIWKIKNQGGLVSIISNVLALFIGGKAI
ncbi:hypothetical protein [Enterovibrio coralii]|uniref:hypothetical protein n=1 Tax=Enterovibrio coralii TaxID=294935 RepID=UPI000B0FA795|nr:hypothetical protein [Enterovibrio coralii]